jgi:hypothetical protein
MMIISRPENRLVGKVTHLKGKSSFVEYSDRKCIKSAICTWNFWRFSPKNPVGDWILSKGRLLPGGLAGRGVREGWWKEGGFPRCDHVRPESSE